jgi:hypothetical protein
MKAVFAFAVVVAFGVGASCAPESEVESNDSRAVQAIVRTTNSPFCPGKTLDSCPSPKASEWRTDIHEWVEADVPPAEIRDRLQRRVPGFDLKPKPLASGWLIPLLALIVSTAWFAFVARRLRPRRRTSSAPAPPPKTPAFDTRLDEELARLD